MITHRHRYLPRIGSFAGDVLVVSAIAVALSACSKSDNVGKTSDDAPVEKASGIEPGFTEVPNIDGLQAKVAATLVPNGRGGAAGFHADGGKLSVLIRELTSDEAKPFDEVKKETEEVLFKKWISSEKTANGFVLQWEGRPLEGNDTTYNYEVRRTVGSKTFTCYGAGANAAEIVTAVETCKSLKSR